MEISSKISVRLPSYSDRSFTNNIQKTLHEKYVGRIKCSMNKHKLLTIKFNNLSGQELFNIGKFIGKEIKTLKSK